MRAENLVILFSDVVGSTELSHLQSAEDADELRRRHFAMLRQALTGAGGTEVKNLGDGLMVVFSSASAALDCAVAMQQAVEYDNRDRRHPAVGLRIGLSGGEVVPEDDDYWGDPVIEAARLCALCDGGQILAVDLDDRDVGPGIHAEGGIGGFAGFHPTGGGMFEGGHIGGIGHR